MNRSQRFLTIPNFVMPNLAKSILTKRLYMKQFCNRNAEKYSGKYEVVRLSETSVSSHSRSCSSPLRQRGDSIRIISSRGVFRDCKYFQMISLCENAPKELRASAQPDLTVDDLAQERPPQAITTLHPDPPHWSRASEHATWPHMKYIIFQHFSKSTNFC